MHKHLSVGLLIIGILGFIVSFPLWLMNKINDHAMLGLTLVLSWAALWYSAYIAIQEAKRDD